MLGNITTLFLFGNQIKITEVQKWNRILHQKRPRKKRHVLQQWQKFSLSNNVLGSVDTREETQFMRTGWALMAAPRIRQSEEKGADNLDEKLHSTDSCSDVDHSNGSDSSASKEGRQKDTFIVSKQISTILVRHSLKERKLISPLPRIGRRISSSAFLGRRPFG